MDWLQELSGPGPFNAKVVNLIVDACPSAQFLAKSGDTRGPNLFASDYDQPADSKKPPVCLFIDNRRFQNDGSSDNFGAGDIDVHAFEIGGSVRVHRAISVGLGVGRISFKSGNGSEAARFLVTAPRVVLKPALLFGSEEFWRLKSTRVKTLAGMIKFYVRNNIISGKLTGADFGLAPGAENYNFAVSHDRVWSSGFVLDLSELLALF
jgi:hypothetical protein